MELVWLLFAIKGVCSLQSIPIKAMPIQPQSSTPSLQQQQQGGNTILQGSNFSEGQLISHTLTNSRNTQYHGVIGVGTPPQNLTVIFDTGSNSLIVTSSRCFTVGCMSHYRFSKDKSSSYENDGRKVTSRFAGGTVEGILAYDTVSIGRKSAARQSIIEMSHESIQGYTMGSFDGVLGVGMNKQTQEKQVSLLDNMGISEFSVWLSSKSGDDGLLVLGGSRSDLHTEPFRFVPVKHTTHWATPMSDVTVGGIPMRLCGPNAKCQAIVDTGTSLITGPKASMAVLHKQVVLDDSCGNMHKLPTVGFMLSGMLFSLDPADYVLNVTGQVLNDSKWFNMLNSMLSFLGGAGSHCIPAMQGLDLPGMENTWILGDAFIRKYYCRQGIKTTFV